MDVEHIRETYYAGQNATQEAFEELCAMVENINVSGRGRLSRIDCIDKNFFIIYFKFYYILTRLKEKRLEKEDKLGVKC